MQSTMMVRVLGHALRANECALKAEIRISFSLLAPEMLVLLLSLH